MSYLENNQLKLIGIDLDGTLLSVKKKVTKKVINALLKLREKIPDIVIAIITGRSSLSAKRVVKELEDAGVKIDYLCSSNGSMLYKINANNQYQKLDENNIDPIKAKIIFDYCLKNKILFQGYLANSKNDKNVVVSNTFFGRSFSLLNKKHSFVSNDFVESEYHKINLISFSKRKLKRFNEHIAENYPEDLEIANIYSTFIEITAKNINKAYALKSLCKLENIDLNQTAVIGDSLNDYSMFKIASYKFAMKRANKKLKQISTYIASSRRNNQFNEIIEKTIAIVDEKKK
ncbi:Cof-type HAD-IIB family hydrolase [Mycoplasma bradburyae]|uniref:HAD family hydrolase n=1 Tax=Mycoplasma bradburyae TaxID=2963128 RepID=A0ABT5G9P7_9MOLU|nr:Cof-type HAD-IIB family hydrolase [Mycoplasma bradburyae]MDC4181637.1 HAD family hydrolase [Mycoplasma bradburyae]MDC4183809.1 HAD family hydrolase [Mycoplasma bradburyae]UTS69941.1 HAD family hydrolase [Mycoplasma bradburyae]